MHLKYRPDIDGLRAFSVVAVVLYHFFPQFFRGGFIGVDVFFVISGYLVTAILLQQNNKNNFSFLAFYARRIRRLLPALIVVLFSCLILGSAVLLSEELQSLGLHTFFATLFSSNFLLINEVGYFDSSSVYKPLLHLWSLAVEEQFYLFWPLVIWLTFSLKRKWLGWALVLAILFSFFYNVLYIHIDQTFVFYSFLTRLWELGLGGLIAYFNFNAIVVNNRFTNNIFSLLGATGLLVSVATINYNVHFPGLMALLPVLSACLLIYSGPDTQVGRLLGQKIPVYLGLISYPVYLWHWPLLAFANIVLSQMVELPLKVFLIVLTFFLSTLTFEFLEKPIRQKLVSSSIILKISFIFVFMGGTGLIFWNAQGFPQRYPEIESVFKSRITYGPSEIESKICKAKFGDVEVCATMDYERSPTVALLGDSHAGPAYYGLKKHYAAKNENMLLLANMAVPPLVDVYVKQYGQLKNFEEVFEYVLKKKSIHTVILSAFWAGYFEESSMMVLEGEHKYFVYDKSLPLEKKQGIIFENSLRRTLKKLVAYGKKVIIVYNVPLVPFNVRRCYQRPLIKNDFSCFVTREYADTNYSGYRKTIAKVIPEFASDTVRTFDPIPALCDQGNCSIIRDGMLIYIDTNHVSLYGSELLFKGFENRGL